RFRPALAPVRKLCRVLDDEHGLVADQHDQTPTEPRNEIGHLSLEACNRKSNVRRQLRPTVARITDEISKSAAGRPQPRMATFGCRGSSELTSASITTTTAELLALRRHSSAPPAPAPASALPRLRSSVRRSVGRLSWPSRCCDPGL